MAATSGAGVIGIFTGMCWGLIFYAILGALGGLAYMLIRGQSSQATPPAAV